MSSIKISKENIEKLANEEEITQLLVTNTSLIIEQIESLVKGDSYTTYLDATVQWANSNNIEVEVLAKIIKKNPKMMGLLEIDAEKLNYLPKTSRLKIIDDDSI